MAHKLTKDEGKSKGKNAAIIENRKRAGDVLFKLLAGNNEEAKQNTLGIGP